MGEGCLLRDLRHHHGGFHFGQERLGIEPHLAGCREQGLVAERLQVCHEPLVHGPVGVVAAECSGRLGGLCRAAGQRMKVGRRDGVAVLVDGVMTERVPGVVA